MDSLNQTRLKLEAEAVLGILEHIEDGRAELVSSTVLELEIVRNPQDLRREHGERVLLKASETVVVDEHIAARAEKLARSGFAAMDALHLSVAESAQVDYFCTCDDQILRKAKTFTGLTMKVVSPLEMIEILES